MKGKTEPKRCPQCRSKDFDIEHEEGDGELVLANCACNSCQYQWTAEYEFTHWYDADE